MSNSKYWAPSKETTGTILTVFGLTPLGVKPITCLRVDTRPLSYPSWSREMTWTDLLAWKSASSELSGPTSRWKCGLWCVPGSQSRDNSSSADCRSSHAMLVKWIKTLVSSSIALACSVLHATPKNISVRIASHCEQTNLHELPHCSFLFFTLGPNRYSFWMTVGSFTTWIFPHPFELFSTKSSNSFLTARADHIWSQEFNETTAVKLQKGIFLRTHLTLLQWRLKVIVGWQVENDMELVVAGPCVQCQKIIYLQINLSSLRFH